MLQGRLITKLYIIMFTRAVDGGGHNDRLCLLGCLMGALGVFSMLEGSLRGQSMRARGQDSRLLTSAKQAGETQAA